MMFHSNKLFAFVLISAAGITHCGGNVTVDKDPLGTDGSNVQPGEGDGGAGGTNSTSSGNAAGTSQAASTSGPGGGNPSSQCYPVTTSTPCNACVNDHCPVELDTCQLDVGCNAICECAEMNMCSGANCLGPCGMVIEMHGGPNGSGVVLALNLSECISFNCQGQCQ
jgi:hypothetical protein